MKTLILGITMTVFGWAGANANMVEPAKLEAMAKAARTAEEHVAVAKQYRLKAEDWEQRAKGHEEEAVRLERRPRAAIEHKWPAFSRQPWQAERAKAMQARRAANECLEVAGVHERKALGLLAEGKARASE